LPFGEKAHTGENIKEKLKTIFDEWDISDKIVGIAIDNAANQVLSIKLLGYKFIRCCAHTIQLAIKDGLNECQRVQEVLKKFERIVKKFKKSAPCLKTLHSVQKSMNEPLYSLLQNVKTRWNSSFYMIERLVQIKSCVILTLSKIFEANIANDLPTITNEDWLIADDLLDLLGPLESITRTLCGEKFATVSLIIPTIRTSIEHLTGLFLKSNDVLKLRAIIVNNLKERFKTIETEEIFQLSTYLDPRFKSAGFSKDEHASNAIILLKEQIKNLQGLPHDVVNSETIDKADSVLFEKQKNKFNIYSELEKHIGKKIGPTNNSQYLDQIQQYHTLPNAKMDIDIFRWWQDRSKQFPHLYELSVKYLYLPATSTASERIFSTVGYVLNQRRTRLTGENLNNILFLNLNQFEQI